MIKRIELIIQSQNLTPSQFADRIGIQRSGLSHILSGRNNPSLDFVQKVLVAFPDLSPAWFLQGKGRMYVNLAEAGTPVFGTESRSFSDENGLGSNEETQATFQTESDVRNGGGEVAFFPANEPEPQAGEADTEMPWMVSADDRQVNTEKGERMPERENRPKVQRILLFYEDGTFEEFGKR
ncbi:MAG: helix-turn-helix domain-containing protein [Bacteroides sp.]|nr:helix-turn-helix domain-containing protein [Ruminococcus flavefaciens]MCM1555583.1 helix-turn-helix domain-containing protein [Bacteroides sp.]